MIVHNAIALFSRPEHITTSRHDQDLIYVISIITATLIGCKFSQVSSDEVDHHLELLLNRSTLQDSLGASISLGQILRSMRYVVL